ncbi:site-specific integrase [Fibrobacter sp. UWR2]|uniref:tyrosine-type recombinase/integrase n=1 Tax=Fibrobacter sp. UWR2 TaxID=1964352 RepID=UPI000B520B21|nr:site-specific integrase [Fibrobacter sp. UWR2]OWU99936.1 hypothetical protein B7994_09705 [Fibrobacter sp. UWR2]
MSDFYAESRAILESRANTLSRYTYETYLSHLHKLQLYRPAVECSDVTEAFVIGYIDFMHSRKNSAGCIYRSLSILRMFVKELLRRRKIRRNPMQNITLKKVRNRREFLEVDELEKLYSGFMEHSDRLNFSEREALRAFLFSCFTGLRFSDLKALTPHDIHNGKIRIFTQKTGAQVYIPIPAQAVALLQGAGETALHVVDNSTFNRNLRAAAKKLDFHSRLHAHIARHTFATSCVSFGVPIEVISKVLGHANIETTLIYANYSNRVIDREMEKFKINVPTG